MRIVEGGLDDSRVQKLLAHHFTSARAQTSLETGSWPYFAPARELYRRHGFVECPPFGNYSAEPNSAFMTLTLGGEA